MKFTRELPGTLTIQSADATGVLIGGRLWTHTIAVTEESVVDSWPQTPVSELLAADFSILLEHSPELIILGTGQTGRFAPRELTFAFARLGVGFETMDTAAAARTFNVLAGEGRKVAAVLYT